VSIAIPAFDERQTAAVTNRASGALAIVGAPGSGKTTALIERARNIAYGDAAHAAHAARATQASHASDTSDASDANPRTSAPVVAMLSPSDAGVARLQALLNCEPSSEPGAAHTAEPKRRIVAISFGELAFDVLRDASARGGNVPAVAGIDEVRAAQHFERAGAEIYALDWSEFSAEVDPEITGLRAPERFAAAAFRLIRKLRAALVSPQEFREMGLRGANAFFAHPPNLADAELIAQTQAKYRDSLRASPEELGRQHRREIDLVKILARLYGSYVETLSANGCLTPVDAVYEAATLLRERPELRAGVRGRYRAALVDDAQDMTTGQLALLEGIFGGDSPDVTLCGDAAQATRGFATGARGADVFKLAATSIELTAQYRCPPAIAAAARRALDPSAPQPQAAAPATTANLDSRPAQSLSFYRAESVRDEARYVAAEIAGLVRGGMRPERIAIVMRNLGCARTYVDALLARDVPADVAGAASIYDYPVVRDALAALWSAVDPFRHDYLLRTLEAPWMRLSDASIAALCGEAADPQPLLFELPDDPAETGDRRWDRRRDLRLGRNVTRGDVDADLPLECRSRLETFRAARTRWEEAGRTLSAGVQARLILDESVLATLGPGARARFDSGLVARLLTDLDAFAGRMPLGTLDDFLIYAESTAEAEADLLSIAPRDRAAVRVGDVEAVKGQEFDAVFAVDVRAGAWPRYYVPDAFLFMPSLGMIPKENVGDARTARTAKFTYALFRYKIREKYNAEERRAFYCAATRARERLYISASGRATRGISAPEILEEMKRSATL
jgi:superfamily I DNA/RNA helicase